MNEDVQGRSRQSVRLVTPARALLFLLLLLASVVAVSAQDGDGPEVGEIVILSQVQGPEGTTTLVEIPASRDTYISSANPNTNYGTSSAIRLGHNAGGDGALRPLIRFSLSSIPAGATINSAKMRLYLYASTGGTTSLGFEARHLVSSWSEFLVTWNNHQPEWGDVFATGSAAATPLGWKESDVTTLVRDWYSGAHANNGFTVIGDERPELERQRWYYSTDANNSFYPRLVVDYTIPPPDTTPPSASVNPLPIWSVSSFTVTWDGEDNPGGSGIDYFDVQYRVNGGVWTDWKMRTTEKSATFEGGAHTALYEFRARAVDKAGNVQAWPGAQTGTRIDSVPPSTSMTPLPQYTTTAAFTVSWQGTDAQSGIAHYDVQGRLNGGAWQTILENTVQTSYQVSGLANGSFAEFRVRATDRANNVQPFPEAPQASTTVVLEPVSVVQPFEPLIMKPTDAVTDTFTVQWVGFTAPGTNITLYELRYRFRPAGTGTATSWTKVSLPSPTAQSVDFDGPFDQDGTYEFEVRAVNSVGQTEPFKNQAEAAKIIDLREPFIEPIQWMPLVHK